MHRTEALIEHSIATLRKTRPELKRLSVAGAAANSSTTSLVAEAPSPEEPAVGAGGLKVHLTLPTAGILGGPGLSGSAAHLEGASQYAGTISCRRCRARHRRRATYLAPGHGALVGTNRMLALGDRLANGLRVSRIVLQPASIASKRPESVPELTAED